MKYYSTLRKRKRTSLVVQWIGIRLPPQGTRVRSLVWDHPTCWGSTKAHAPHLLNLPSRVAATEAHMPWSPCLSTRERSPKWDAHALQLESSPHPPQLEKAHVRQGRCNAPKNQSINNLKNKRKKEGNFDSCYNMDDPWALYAKWNKPVMERQVLYEFTPMKYLE